MPSSLAPLPPGVPGPSTSPHSHSSPVSVSASASASTSTQSQTHSNHGNHPSSSSAPFPPSPETARQITEARTALNASIQNIFTPHEHALKLRAQNLHQNSAALTKQESDLKKEIGKLGREGDKLEKVVREGQKRVKELGNVQNWAEVLERDFLVVGEVLRLVDGGSDGEGWSGGGSESESEWSEDEDGGRAGKREGVQERGAGLDGTGEEDRNDIDTHMSGVATNDDTSIHDTNCMHPNGNGKGKGKEIEEEMESSEHMEVMDTEESSISRNASNSEASSSSIRTSASGMS